MPADPQTLARLENQVDSIRNVCILAHIDHGKTSLSDCLLASNGIISQEHQGEIRYLDSRPDEQERGITMEASAISLFFRTATQEYVVNLIDSPGHVDFSSEVTQSSRLCDAAIILVDALEGVCSQTVSALKQAWDEDLQSILVVNKLDKLYEEWQMSASDAASHLSKLVEQVNAVWGQFYVGRRMETEEDNDDVLYFSPANNNVVFCSALQGWGFTIQQFAVIYENKLGVDRSKLAKFLWGDFYLDPKTKKVVAGVKSGGSKRKTMFQQFILDNIWAVYAAVADEDTYKLDRIVQALHLPKPVTDPSDVRQIFNQWIPVSRAVLSGIITLPSPAIAQGRRLESVLRNTPSPTLVDPQMQEALAKADKDGPQLAYVSKVVSVPESDIPVVAATTNVTDKLAALRLQSERLTKQGDVNNDSNYVVLGFARIYSGEFNPGMELDLLGPRYDPANPSEFRTRVSIKGLYLFMGRDLVPVTKAGPGAIVGFGGLDGKITKSGTLVKPGSHGPNLARSAKIAAPILRTAIEPQDPTKLDELENGLRLLNVSDPSVEFEISDLGEFILATAGELHLERCLIDLATRYAKVEIDVFPPIVPFRETIRPPFGGEGPTSIDVGGFHLVLEVRPREEEKTAEMSTEKESEEEDLAEKDVETGSEPLSEQDNSGDGGSSCSSDGGGSSPVSKSQALSVRDNVLLDETPDGALLNGKLGAQSVFTGFKTAMSRGPLIQEPVSRVDVIIKELSTQLDTGSTMIAQRRLISATQRAIQEAMKQWSPRIMLAMYMCEIQASTEVLGRVYGVITRRKGKVLTEELKEGTPFFLIKAQIPVVESIGFSEEIRKKTSGAANPQLMFSGFEILDEDPYWVPTTEEELEFQGEIADRESIALGYVNQIRRRKGLAVGEKLVDGAERDRTHRH